MKYVHTAAMVAHLWANKSQESARVASGNFYFVNKTLFSYGSHFVCAHHMPADYSRDGRALALINSGRYSVTTGRHMDSTFNAINASRTFCASVPNLSGSMVHGIARYGAGEVVADMLAKIRNMADLAANTRIRPATRGSHLHAIKKLRADALHIASVDAKRKDLDASYKKTARAQLKALTPEVPEDGADKEGAIAYAFSMNRSQYKENMEKEMSRARSAHHNAMYNVECGNFAMAARFAKNAGDLFAMARQCADKAQNKLPRAFTSEMRAIAIGTAWRVDVEARAHAEHIGEALDIWNINVTVVNDALAEKEFYKVSRFVNGDARRAFETLNGEPGDDTRREFMDSMRSELSAWNAKDESEKARARITAAHALFTDGKFSAASNAARSALHHMQRANGAFTIEETTAAESLANRADALKPEEYAAQLVAWRDCELGARFPSTCHTPESGAFLRINATSQRVETSQGAEVPASVCALMWRLIGQQRATGAARSFDNVKLGSFSLDSIDADGNVRAGCHFIRYAELADIAARLSFE